MNLEIAEKAIISLQNDFGPLPKRGFLAGGALANRIYQIKYGVRLPVNDIDIFNFEDNLLDINEINGSFIIEDKKLFHAEIKDCVELDNYGGYLIQTKTSKGYIVTNSIRNDIFNEINLKSSHNDPNIVLKSFDLNCTQVGYDLETHKFYSTPEWDTFLEIPEIKVTSLHTPAHTILRLFKKCDEFNLNIIDDEMILLKYALEKGNSYQRKHFTEKYKIISDKYEHLLLKNNLKVVSDINTNKFLKNKTGQDFNVWTIVSHNMHLFDDIENYFKGWNLLPDSIFGNLNKLLWAFRNIYGKEKTKFMTEIWNHIHQLYEHDDFIESFNNEKVNFYGSLYKIAPNLPKQVDRLNISIKEHWNHIDRLFNRFEPNIALSLCWREDTPLYWDESDELLMELSVRIKSQMEDTIKKSLELIC